MRVTDNLRTGVALSNLADLRERHLKSAEQASSGLKVNRPSDDATVASRLTRTQRLLEQNDSMGRSLALGRSDLELAESTLAEASDLMKRAKEIALSASNGSSSASVRQSAAQEIAGIRTAMLGLSNTKGVRGYIFSGSRTDTAAFDSAYNFQGDSYEHAIRSGPTSEVTISASGERAFTAAGGRDIFGDLANLETAMLANDQAGIMAALDLLDDGHRQITMERARAGVNLTRVEQSDQILTNGKSLIQQQQAGLGGADPAETLTNLTNLEQSVQRALGVTQKMLGLDAFTVLGRGV